MDMDEFYGNNTAIGNTKPAAKNLTPSLGARGPLMDDGVHALGIDVSDF